jgi:hypothetical protein
MSSEPAVYNWDKIILKPVRSKDTVTIHDGRYEYKVSKNDVEGFNGGEVFLLKDYADLQKSKIKP